MKKVMVIAVVLLVAMPVVAANKTQLTYSPVSRYHGMETFGDRYVHPGVSSTIEGIDVGAVTHYENNADDLKYWDTRVGAAVPIKGVDLRAGYGYLLLPNGMDVQEISATLGLPLGLRYTLAHAIPDNAKSGQVHILGIDYPFGDPNAISGLLSAEVEYNDGVNPGLFDGPLIRDFTHLTAGLQINIPIGDMILQPGVIYQHTFEESIEPDKNEVWYIVDLQYNF